VFVVNTDEKALTMPDRKCRAGLLFASRRFLNKNRS